MRHWSAAAEQLAQVRAAQEEFLVRDLIDSWLIGPMLLDRLAADLAKVPPRAGISVQPRRLPADER